jgi:3D (Asp-Asp-Asp) domain-containing protein
MKRYKYKQGGCLPFLAKFIFLLFMMWLMCWYLPDLYFDTVGRKPIPPETRIIEPAVMSTQMLEAERTSREQAGAEARAEVLTETQYIAMQMEVAAYSPLDNKSGICADNSPNVTATGTKPCIGTIAVNPSVIGFGRKMYVDGYGWGISCDTGQIIRENSNQIEVFMPTYEEAVKWGRQKNITVFVEVEG